MKYNIGYNTNQGTCLPPEAYIRLVQAAQQENRIPKFRSSVYPLPKQKKTIVVGEK